MQAEATCWAYLIETKVAALEPCHAAQHRIRLITSARHLLPRFVLVPLLAGGLPLDQTIDLSDGFPPVNVARVHATLEQRVHVKPATAVGTVA